MPRSSTTFKKGQVTNPKGRPKTDPETRKQVLEIFNKASPDAARNIVLLMETAPKHSDRFAAAKFIIEYSLGKASENINLNANVQTEIKELDLSNLTKDQQEALIDTLSIAFSKREDES